MLIFQLKYNVYSFIDYCVYFTCYIKFFLLKLKQNFKSIINWGIVF